MRTAVGSAALMLLLAGTTSCAVAPRDDGDPPRRREWFPAERHPGAEEAGPVRVTGMSVPRPIPGKPLVIAGAGFGTDREDLLVRIVGGTVGQTRARWVRPAQVSDTELTVLVPTEMTGAGLLEVETSAGRSGVVIVQYLDARPRITLLKRLPFETVVALTSATPLPESGELLVDGQTAGAVTRTGESTYSAPSMFHRTGPHDVTVRFADGLETPPYSVP